MGVYVMQHSQVLAAYHDDVCTVVFTHDGDVVTIKEFPAIGFSPKKMEKLLCATKHKREKLH
jgi:hypothetical protein